MEENKMHLRIVEREMEFGWLFIVIFSILIILGIIQLVTMLSRSRSRETHGESPLHILKRRYAKGEITREEFEKMKDEFTRKIC
jgi:putative membrane protein